MLLTNFARTSPSTRPDFDPTPLSFPVISKYPYKPLNPATDTRLLLIEPGTYDDDINCSLFHTSRAEHNEYEALSYVWGNAMATRGPTDLDVETYAVVYGEEKKNEPVETVSFRDLPDHPYYERLYYAAGGPRRPGQITIDGVKVAIGGELYAALKRLRSLDERLVLWVDALCINQADVAERTEHVIAMGSIYASAKNVRIWLGDEVGNEHLAYETLEAIAKKLEELHKEGIERNMVSAAFFQDKSIRGLHWDSLSELLSRAWFQRVWIIQEVSNAADAVVHVGRISWSWEYFATIVKLLRFMDIDLFLWSRGELTATDSMVLIENLRATGIDKNSSTRPPLLDILRDSRAFKCTLASDKIFGILGLASDADSVDVDYSIDTSEVYKRFAISYLTDRHSLDALYCCAKTDRPSRLTLPSWVPDWTQPCHHEPLIFRKYPSKASGSSKLSFKLSPDRNSLFIYGKTLDTIEAVEHLRRIPRNTELFCKEGLEIWGSRHEAWLETCVENTRDWTRNVMKVAFPDNVCTPASYEALWRSFICNKTPDLATPPLDWGQAFSDFLAISALSEERRKAYLDNWRSENSGNVYDLREKTSSETRLVKKARAANEFKQAYGMWCYNRRFFRTEGGRFGWAPNTARAGDEICILFGGDVPFLLRRDGKGCYEVIGDAYLHDFMDGEAMDRGIEEREYRLV